MRSLRLIAVVVLVTLAVTPVMLLAQRRISLGSIAPANSLWDKSLKRMAVDIQKATDRRVRIKVASGSQGDETAIVRRLKLGTTQAATLTQIGLSEIDEAFGVLGMPFFFESDAEARHVLEALQPRFQKRTARAGFSVGQLGTHRMGTPVLQGADQLARRAEGGQAVHVIGRQSNGGLVQGERLQSGAAGAE